MTRRVEDLCTGALHETKRGDSLEFDFTESPILARDNTADLTLSGSR